MLGVVLALPGTNGTGTYVDQLRAASSVLKGHMVTTDVTTDFFGFRALIYGKDPYPIIAVVANEEGIDWPVQHASTHPPTAYLVAAPVALLPLGWAVSLWCWGMLSLVAIGFRKMEFSWFAAIGLALLSLLWPPFALSLAQLTPIWLLAVVCTVHMTGRVPGLIIALATMTKYYPCLLLWPSIVRREVATVLTAIVAGVVAVVTLWWLNPDIFSRYLEVNRSNSPEIVARLDNASPIVNAYRHLGAGGALSLVAGLSAVWFGTLRQHRDRAFSALLCAYLSVALLPIVWIYSTLPLLPILIWFIRRRPFSIVSVPAYCSFAILMFCPRWGVESVNPIVVAILLPGLSFLLEAHYRSQAEAITPKFVTALRKFTYKPHFPSR